VQQKGALFVAELCEVDRRLPRGFKWIERRAPSMRRKRVIGVPYDASGNDEPLGRALLGARSECEAVIPSFVYVGMETMHKRKETTSSPKDQPDLLIEQIPFNEALRRMLSAPPAHKKAAKKAAKRVLQRVKK